MASLLDAGFDLLVTQFDLPVTAFADAGSDRCPGADLGLPASPSALSVCLQA
jgi:hypothetical protein